MWWFFYGLIVGAGGMGLISWVLEDNISIGWYVWLIAVLALLLGTLTVQHFAASLRELEPKAARMGLLVMGVPALVLAGVASWLFVIA